MILLNKRNKCLILGFLIVIPLFFSLFKIPVNNKNLEIDDINNIGNAGDEIIPLRNWITNGNFVTSDDWIIEEGMGDQNDISSNIDSGEYNTQILGSEESKSIILSSSSYSDWIPFSKPEDPLVPNGGYGVNNNGVWCSHQFDDTGADQVPIIHFRNDVNMDQPMDDYKITSASLEVNIDAYVDYNIDTPQDDIDGHDANNDGDPINQGESYDSCRFYIEISDLNTDKINTYEVGSNQTVEFGYGDPYGVGGTDYLNGPMEIRDEQVIIDSLSNVLKVHSTNFTVILGIYIYSADNFQGQEEDYWDFLSIDYVNLTFTYQKIIDQSTNIILNQACGSINDDILANGISSYNYYTIDYARCNFSYKAEPYWPSASQNSEIRVTINNDPNYVSRKLNLATSSWDQASLNLVDLISGKDDVNVSIEIYIADEFSLNETIEVSIDDVSLEIEYTVYFDDYSTSLQILINGQDVTATPYLVYPVREDLDIVVRYLNETSGRITGADVSITGDIFRDLNPVSNQYEITLNTTEDFQQGDNNIVIQASKKNYDLAASPKTINVRKLVGEIKRFGTEDNEINVLTNQPTLVQLILNDTDNDEYIKGATVTYTGGLGYGVFTDPNNDGIYNATILIEDDGYYSMTISATAGSDYSFNTYLLNFNSTTQGKSISTYWLFLNDADRTSQPSLTISTRSLVNITIVYRNQTDQSQHVPGASIELTEEGKFIGNLQEKINHYSININTTEDLDIGTNYLTLTTPGTSYYTGFTKDFTIIVERITTEIRPINISGGVLQIETGESPTLRVNLYDIYDNTTISGAFLSYVWEYDLDGDDVLDFIDNGIFNEISPGIYEITLNDLQEGNHKITITYVEQGDYSTDTIEIVIQAITPVTPPGPEPFNYLWVVVALGLVIVGLSAYFAIYQKILKYPPTVRKIRKLKKKIGKRKKPKSKMFGGRTEYIKTILEDQNISTVLIKKETIPKENKITKGGK